MRPKAKTILNNANRIPHASTYVKRSSMTNLRREKSLGFLCVFSKNERWTKAKENLSHKKPYGNQAVKENKEQKEKKKMNTDARSSWIGVRIEERKGERQMFPKVSKVKVNNKEDEKKRQKNKKEDAVFMNKRNEQKRDRDANEKNKNQEETDKKEYVSACERLALAISWNEQWKLFKNEQ